MKPKDLELEEELKRIAKERFIRCGYHATRISDIAQEAGRSACSIYTYFKDKEDLFNACVYPAKRDKQSARDYPLEFCMIIEKEDDLAKLLSNIAHLEDLV